MKFAGIPALFLRSRQTDEDMYVVEALHKVGVSCVGSFAQQRDETALWMGHEFRGWR